MNLNRPLGALGAVPIGGMPAPPPAPDTDTSPPTKEPVQQYITPNGSATAMPFKL